MMITKNRCYIPAGFKQVYFALTQLALEVFVVLSILNLVPVAFAQEAEPSIGSISGHVFDADTTNPLPYTTVVLSRCMGGEDYTDCYYVAYMNWQLTDQDGQFQFTTDEYGQPLAVGIYQIEASREDLYNTVQTEFFHVAEGENYDVGDIFLQPIKLIGSISGWVVDAVTNDPLPGGDTPPYASVELYRCMEQSEDESLSCYSVSWQPVSRDGKFQFSGNQLLEIGTYQVLAYANEYQLGQTDFFYVAEGEDYDVGDIPLEPYPIQFSEIRPCGDLPSEGGTCSYSVRVENRSDTSINGAIWSIVDSWGIGSLVDHTLFQAGNPQRVTLASGKSRVMQFDFTVPSSVNDYAYICTQVYFGQDRLNPFFNTLAQRYLFCIEKGFGGFSVISEKDALKLNQQSNRRALNRPKGK